MKKIQLTFLFVFAHLLGVINMNAQEIIKDWAINTGGLWADQGNAVVSDSEGNIYTTGSFQGKMFIKGKVVESNGDTDIFISKFNKLGELLWVKSAGSKIRKRNTVTEYGTDLLIVNDQFLYVTGVFSLKAKFDHLNITSKGQDDIFIAKYTTKGELIWVKSAGGASQDIPYSLDADIQGNIYLTGSFQKRAVFDDLILKATNSTELFIAKCNPNGKFLWVKQSFSNSMTVGKSIDCNSTYCVIGGNYKDEMSFEGVTLGTKDKEDIFIAQIDLDGNLKWINTLEEKNTQTLEDLTIKNGHIYFIGNFYEQVNSSINAIGKKDILIGNYKENGELMWLNSIGGKGNDEGHALAITDDEEIFISGVFEEKLELNGIQLESNGNNSAFLLSINSKGNLNWGEVLIGNKQHVVNDIFINKKNVYVTGYFRGDFNLFGQYISSGGSSDIFLLRLNNIYDESDNVSGLGDFNVFPNPNNGIFNLTSKFKDKAEKVSISVYNVQGILLQTQTFKDITSLNTKIDISNYQTGLYFVKTLIDERLIVRRVVIK